MDTVRQAAHDLVGLDTKPHNLAGARGLAVGALYSLARAREFANSPTFSGRLGQFSAELDKVLGSIADGDAPDQRRWLAGYYFNSALFRLAFAAERALKLLSGSSSHNLTLGPMIDQAETTLTISGEQAKALRKLKKDVDLIKHDPTEWRQRKIRNLEEAEGLVSVVQDLLTRHRP